jgi:hypothetical protein
MGTSPNRCRVPATTSSFQRALGGKGFRDRRLVARAGVVHLGRVGQRLPARIAAAQAAGDPDIGDTYYHHWLGALEDLLSANGIGPAVETARWREAW